MLLGSKPQRGNHLARENYVLDYFIYINSIKVYLHHIRMFLCICPVIQFGHPAQLLPYLTNFFDFYRVVCFLLFSLPWLSFRNRREN